MEEVILDGDAIDGLGDAIGSKVDIHLMTIDEYIETHLWKKKSYKMIHDVDVEMFQSKVPSIYKSEIEAYAMAKQMNGRDSVSSLTEHGFYRVEMKVRYDLKRVKKIYHETHRRDPIHHDEMFTDNGINPLFGRSLDGGKLPVRAYLNPWHGGTIAMMRKMLRMTTSDLIQWCIAESIITRYRQHPSIVALMERDINLFTEYYRGNVQYIESHQIEKPAITVCGEAGVSA